MEKIKRYIKQVIPLVTVALIVLLCASVAYAATWKYAFPTTIVDNSSTTRTYYPVFLGYGGQQLIDAGYIDANGLDTNMQIGTTNIKYMISTGNVTAVIPNLPSDGQVKVSLYTGYDPPQTNFSLIVGEGGYISIDDDEDLELGDNFTIEQKGYFDTTYSADKNLVYKEGAFRIYVSGADNITAAIYSGGAWSVNVSATGVVSGEHIIRVTADKVRLKIFIDYFEEDSTLLSGANVTDSGNAWTIMEDDCIPYMEYMMIWLP